LYVMADHSSFKPSLMNRAFVYTVLIILIPVLLSLTVQFDDPASIKTKQFLNQGIQNLKSDVSRLYEMPGQAPVKQVQEQFKKVRASYKRVEALLEYFYPYFAGRLNGPPIPFFEEAEPDKMQQEPEGLQLIESELFPTISPGNIPAIKNQVSEISKYIEELSSIQESFEMNEENVFDAIMEELYRITALGISGFDSQVAINSLPECSSALTGLQLIIGFHEQSYEEILPGKHRQLDSLLTNANAYLQQNPDFNKFNRMDFILQYLNPVTSIIAKYKNARNLKDNPSAIFYSAIKKNGTLFDPAAFDPYRFLDDHSTSRSKIELGRRLFFETRLSSDNTRSCASCHQPSKAFTDGVKTASALDGHSPLRRNTPTILNAALQRNLFLDSRSTSLETQVMEVLNNALEMSGSAITSAQTILKDSGYNRLYTDAYPSATEEKLVINICNAIASYERTLVNFNSKFDKHMNGQPSMNDAAIKGFNLFMGKAKCATCHFIPAFNGSKPPRYYYVESEVIGVPSTTAKRKPTLDADSGRYLATNVPLHLFSFKTPTLRNIALTAPYMHNGVYQTLEEVIEFYNKGGGKGLGISPPNQSLPFDKLGLSGKEKHYLVEFLKTLDTTMPLTNP
jgi:cytochrome c peroxidase